MLVKDVLGQWGERKAVEHLQAAGLRIVERNWRCAAGEIDIIATEGRSLVFVEVKTRSSVAFGEPAEAVNRRKIARLRMLAATWLALQSRAWPEIRIDVISVLWNEGRAPAITHLRGVS